MACPLNPSSTPIEQATTIDAKKEILKLMVQRQHILSKINWLFQTF